MVRDGLSIQRALGFAECLSGEGAIADATMLLCWVLDCNSAYLRVWPDKLLQSDQAEKFRQAISERQQGRPVAHIIGTQPFWTIELEVSAATLIPRQDTETLVETVLQLDLPDSNVRVLDLGTGTGAIALSLAKEKPAWKVFGVDFSPEVVELANRNAIRNKIENAEFQVSDWFDQINVAASDAFQVIVSNPPYIAENDSHLEQGDLRFEASSALVSADNGMADIQTIIEQAASVGCREQGFWLALEHGFEQGELVRDLMQKNAYKQIRTERDLPGNERVTLGFYRKV